MHLVYRYRVRNLEGTLNGMARSVNFVWNYCNNAQKHALKWNTKWPGPFELMRLTAGVGAELGIGSDTVNAVCKQYANSRYEKRRPHLRYRGKRSLGWVPVKGRSVKQTADGFRFYGHDFRVFMSRPLPEGKICDRSSFSRDAKGNWFLNLVIEIQESKARAIRSGVGIDLGLKDFATFSTGEKIPAPRHYRHLEERLATAQRARKRRQVTNLHARIANRRKDFLHKLSTRIVREFDLIAVGNVNAAGLAKTSMAKSVNDAGWSDFRNALRYKAIRHGVQYQEVSERFTTRSCSACGVICAEWPQGIAGIGIREWVCSGCGCIHDRDVNAAKNILLRHGHVAPVVGIAA